MAEPTEGSEQKTPSVRIGKRAALIVVVLLFLLSLILVVPARSGVSGLGQEGIQNGDKVTLCLVGRVANTQGSPVNDAHVQILIDDVVQVLNLDGQEAERTHTDRDGFFVAELAVSASLVATSKVEVEIDKGGFRTTRQRLSWSEIACAKGICHGRFPDLSLPRVFNAAFFLATAIFVIVFALISLNVFHETIAAFLGATAMLGISYLVGTFNVDFWIIGFGRAVQFVDLDVVFLIMTLMIVVSIIGRTGVFQWLALEIFRYTRGSAWRLAIILMLVTAAMSALLNNVTIMLLMAPITIEIALMLDISPASLLIPEALASNIGGIATLIGDPPNTVIGSFAELGFNQFLIHMGPIAVIATVTLIGIICLIYRRDYAAARQTPSKALLARLEKDAQITDPVTLRRALLIVALMLVLFLVSELFHMPPSVVGLIGATLLLIWVQPDVEEMLGEVDWTTLMFFIALFIVVGGVQEVGLIQLIAELVADVAGQDLFVATQSVIWLSAVASAIVNNIPFTTAFLPIAAYLTGVIPSASNNVLYWSLSLGANLGGNATYVGSAPNVVAAGYLERAGYRVTFADWLKVGVPVTVATILVPMIWLVVRYFWLQF